MLLWRCPSGGHAADALVEAVDHLAVLQQLQRHHAIQAFGWQAQIIGARLHFQIALFHDLIVYQRLPLHGRGLLGLVEHQHIGAHLVARAPHIG